MYLLIMNTTVHTIYHDISLNISMNNTQS
jgi:hypothetical protein